MKRNVDFSVLINSKTKTLLIMKQITIILISIITCLGFIACNNEPGNNKTETRDSIAMSNDTTIKKYNMDWFESLNIEVCNSAGGYANFFVSEAEGKTMQGDFTSIYKTDLAGDPIDALLDNYWIDACAIAEISAYLTKKKHDGIRIYMGCDLTATPGTYPKPPYQNKSSIFIFPTNYDATIVDPTKSKHITYKNSALYLGSCAQQSDYIKEYAFADPRIKKFDGLYRNNNDSLSLSVWIDSCVINGLNALLKANPTSNDGAFFSLGAYQNISPQRAAFQKFNKQSTILILPSKPNGTGGHEPDWNLINQISAFAIKIAPPGGFNHGELCPQKCD